MYVRTEICQTSTQVGLTYTCSNRFRQYAILVPCMPLLALKCCMAHISTSQEIHPVNASRRNRAHFNTFKSQQTRAMMQGISDAAVRRLTKPVILQLT